MDIDESQVVEDMFNLADKAETSEEVEEVVQDEVVKENETDSEIVNNSEEKEVEKSEEDETTPDPEKKEDSEEEVKKTPEELKAEEELAEKEKEEEKPEPEADPFYEEIIGDNLIPEGEYKTKEEKQEAVKAHLQQFKDVNETFRGLIKDNPEMGVLFKSLGEKKDFVEALIDAGIPDLFPSEDEPDFEKFQERVKKNRESLTEKNEATIAFESNIKDSAKTVNDYVGAIEDTTIGQKIRETLTSTLTDYEQGKVSKSLVDIIHKGLTAEAQLKALEDKLNKKHNAEIVKVKNGKITAKKIKDKGEDNVPDLSGKAKKSSPNKAVDSVKSFFSDIHEVSREY